MQYFHAYYFVLYYCMSFLRLLFGHQLTDGKLVHDVYDLL